MIFTRENKEGYLDNPVILNRCLCIYYNNTMFYYTDDVDLIPMLIHYGYRPINMKLFSELYAQCAKSKKFENIVNDSLEFILDVNPDEDRLPKLGEMSTMKLIEILEGGE